MTMFLYLIFKSTMSTSNTTKKCGRKITDIPSHQAFFSGSVGDQKYSKHNSTRENKSLTNYHNNSVNRE